MHHEALAMVFEIDRKTLLKHFEYELSVGAYRERSKVIEAIQSAALKGNVPAAREYLRLEPGIAAPPPEAEPDAKPIPEGKKAQAHEAAKTAQVGTGWDGLLPSARVQ